MNILMTTLIIAVIAIVVVNVILVALLLFVKIILSHSSPRVYDTG